MNLQTQIHQAAFPAEVQVTAYNEGVDLMVLRICQRGPNGVRGLEIALTREASEMYGEGPAVATVLDQLRRHLIRGLPEVGEDGQYPRLTFMAD